MGYHNKDVSVRHRHRLKRQKKVRRQHKKCEHKKRKRRREVARVGHVKKCARAFTECKGLPFRDFLSIEVVQELMEELGLEFRDRIYTPYVALWAFLSQVINKEKS